MNDKDAVPTREQLQAYSNQRVEVVANFVQFGNWYDWNSRKHVTTALLKDARVIGNDSPVEHVWLHHAVKLKDFSERIGFTERFKGYKRKLANVNSEGLMYVGDYCLELPENFRALDRAEGEGAAEVNGQPEGQRPPVANDYVAVITEVRCLAHKVGGWDSLSQLIVTLRG